MSSSCSNSECRAFNFVFNKKEIFICKHVKNWWYWFVIFLTWFYFHFKVPCSSQHRKTQRPNFSTQTVWNVWKPTKPIGRLTAHQCPLFTNMLSSVEAKPSLPDWTRITAAPQNITPLPDVCIALHPHNFRLWTWTVSLILLAK